MLVKKSGERSMKAGRNIIRRRATLESHHFTEGNWGVLRGSLEKKKKMKRQPPCALAVHIGSTSTMPKGEKEERGQMRKQY